MKRGFLIVVVVVLGVVFGYSWLYPTYTIRYRITVNATAGGTQHSGSSIVEMRIVTQPRFADSPPWNFYVNGEAPFVDLGNGHNLVAVFQPVGPEQNSQAHNPPYRGSRDYLHTGEVQGSIPCAPAIKPARTRARTKLIPVADTGEQLRRT